MNMGHLEPYSINDFHFLGCCTFQKNGRNFLLGENGCAIIIDDMLTDSIRKRSLQPGLKLKLVQHGLAYVPGKVMFCSEKEIDIRYFILDLTGKCNFNCVYCFRDFHDKESISMNVLNDILQYILNYCRKEGIKRIGLQMWGGEPLFAMEQIEYVAEFFRRTELQVFIDVETNASLITDEIAGRLFRLGIHMGVSIDGPPMLQNRQRPTASGKASADSVEKGIRSLQKFYKDDIGGITVITRHNFQYIKEMLDYFIYRLHLGSIKFNLVRDNEHAGEGKLALDEEEILWFSNELLDYLQAFKSMGAEFSEGNVEIRVKNLLQRSNASCCISHGCQGGKKIISFDRAGNIFPCEMIDFPEERIGSIYDGDDIGIQLERAMGENPFFLKRAGSRCNGCPWWYYCQGGCSSRNRYLHRDGQIDEVECSLNRAIYPRLVEGILDGFIC